MTAAELIADLQLVPPDTQIRVYADHGQQCMVAHTTTVHYIRSCDLGKNVADVVEPEDVDDIDAIPLVQIFEIGAP